MDDLIDRDAALKKFIEGDGDDDFTTGYNWAVDEYRQKIAKIPAVNRWIPCREGMPEDRCGVIFTVDRGHPFVCVGYRINGEREGLKLQRWFDKLSGLNFSDYDVKAWMPMPYAYEPTVKE